MSAPMPLRTPGEMLALQGACLAIVAVWLVLRLHRAADKRTFLARFLLLSVAAWVGEETCIRLYAFYAYSPGWAGFIDRVPLAIVCIWPVVVLSAMDLASALLGGREDATPSPRASVKFAFVVMALVVADASLIEPIAVATGLWHWTEPGPFRVPIVGILGWGYFAFGAALVRGRTSVLLAGPASAHAWLVASWWFFFRWLPRGEDELPFVVAAALVSFALTALVLARRVSLLRADLVTRIPGATFFFFLLLLYARENTSLVLYAFAFAPPYLALTVRSRSNRPMVSPTST